MSDATTPSLKRQAWAYAATVLVVSRAAYFVIAYTATHLLDIRAGGADRGFLDMWENWDSGHFIAIAEHGYEGGDVSPYAAAFFPLYPLAIRALSILGFPPIAAGLLISAAGSLVAFAFLYRLVGEEFSERAARNALWLLALFPTGVFLVAPYSESLFLAGAVPAFYYARRAQWLSVAPPAAVATATRVAGVFLLLGLGLEFLRQRNFDRGRVVRALGAVAAGALPLVLYALFLKASTGNAFEFLDAQQQGWGRTLTSPIDAFATTVDNASNPLGPTNFMLAWRVEIAAALVGIAATIWVLAKREWGYGAYLAATMAALITSTYYLSVPRMLLTLFPIVILLAASFETKPWLRMPVLTLFAAVAFTGTVVYTQERWFF